MFFGVGSFVFLFLFFLTGLSLAQGSFKKDVESRPLLGTIVTMDVCYAPGQEAVVHEATTKAWQRLGEIHDRMNRFDAKSDVSLINRAAGQSVLVHEDVYRLIKESKRLFGITDGALDVAIGPLVALWDQAEKMDRYPSKEEVSARKVLTDVNKIMLLDDGNVQLLDPAMRIDLNSVVSGFAADEAARIMMAKGLHDFLIDTGGEIYAGGKNCEGKRWRIGVEDPAKRTAPVEFVELSDMAVSTSGDYEGFYKIRGQHWSHEINPVTGYPANKVASATVIASTALEADALSTVLCVLGPEAGLKLIGSLGPAYSAMIMVHGSDGNLERRSTLGYEKFRSRP